MSRTLVHRETQTLDHSVDEVWSVVADFGGVETWVPSVSSCTVDGNGIGAVRTVIRLGMSIQEKLEVIDSTLHIINYRIMDTAMFPLKGLFGTIQLDGHRGGNTNLVWTADAESIDDDGLAVVRPVMDEFIKESIAGLRLVLDGRAKDFTA